MESSLAPGAVFKSLPMAESRPDRQVQQQDVLSDNARQGEQLDLDFGQTTGFWLVRRLVCYNRGGHGKLSICWV